MTETAKCTTTQATYERLFNTKLKHEQRVIDRHNKETPFVFYEWVEQKQSTLPDQLKDKAKYVELERKLYLTE